MAIMKHTDFATFGIHHQSKQQSCWDKAKSYQLQFSLLFRTPNDLFKLPLCAYSNNNSKLMAPELIMAILMPSFQSHLCLSLSCLDLWQLKWEAKQLANRHFQLSRDSYFGQLKPDWLFQRQIKQVWCSSYWVRPSH